MLEIFKKNQKESARQGRPTKLSHAFSGALRTFSFWMANGSVRLPLLDGIDYSQALLESPSLMEKAYPVRVTTFQRMLASFMSVLALSYPTVASADVLAKSGYEAGRDGILLLTEKCPADITGELSMAVSRINGAVVQGCYVVNNRGNAVVKWSDGSIKELDFRLFGSEKLKAPTPSSGSSGFSPWEYFENKTTAGAPVCGIFSATRDKADVRNASLKQLANKDTLSITLYNERWDFKQGSSVSVIVDFADNQPLKLSAYADGKVLDFYVPKELTATFLLVVADSKVIRFKVGQGAEKIWSVPLHDVRAPLKRLVQCALAQKTPPAN